MGGTKTESHTVCPASIAVVGDMDEAARRLDEQMAALPISHVGGRKREPSEVESEMLLKYWRTRSIDGMARVFGVAENTLRRWARDAGLLQ